MNNMEKFCLKWNEFETNIRESFRELREEQNHFDVTLATDDGHQIEAHKIILSAGSKTFNDLLKKTKHPSPFIYLRGIDSDALEYVVDFLYNGEAHIAQEELNKFLETAQELQVKGLQRKQEDDSGQQETVWTTNFNVDPNCTEIKKNNNMKNQDLMKQESILDSLDLEELADTYNTNDVALVRTEEDDLGLNTSLELDLQMIQKNEEMWQCEVCGKIAKGNRNIKYHVETHIEGVSHTCDICNKTFSTRNNLKVHMEIALLHNRSVEM